MQWQFGTGWKGDTGEMSDLIDYLFVNCWSFRSVWKAEALGSRSFELALESFSDIDAI